MSQKWKKCAKYFKLHNYHKVNMRLTTRIQVPVLWYLRMYIQYVIFNDA